MLWTPVALGLGSASYFILPKEPLSWAAWLAVGLALGLLVAAGRASAPRPMMIACVLAACTLGGFGAAKLRSDQVAAPVASGTSDPLRVEGWVVDVVSPGEGGRRLLIAPYRIGDWAPEATPIRVRVTLRGGPTPSPGEPVSVLAILNPPPAPASPGSYDFARDAWFQSVGAVGFALSAVESWQAEAEAPWRLRLEMKINALRWALSRRIVETLGPTEGGLAAAMSTGHEAFIPPEQVDALRVAGLAHIISISGLHMAIVGGFVFAGVRLSIALSPWLALRIDGKRTAAAFGLAAVLGYLVLSGAPPPAERAAITASVAFGAILVGRQAISLHALALAAMAVILLQPEAVTQPGFQMSFAATAALVALADAWPRAPREIDVPWAVRAFQRLAGWSAAAVAISLVAGLATAPFALQHFNRMSTYGLVANVASEPISALLLMPGLAIGAALTPLGLGDAPLAVAGLAIRLMTDIASAIAGWPYAQVVVASGPPWTLAAAFLGILMICLWKGPLRWVGLPLALAVSLAPKPAMPDAWVANDGAALAVRAAPEAILFRPGVKLFGAELWARRRGLEPALDPGRTGAVYDCDAWSCLPRPGAPVPIAAAWNLRRPLAEGRFEAMCASAEVVVVRNTAAPEACPGRLVLTGKDFERGGAAELYREAGGWRAVWTQDLRGRRPWTWGPDLR